MKHAYPGEAGPGYAYLMQLMDGNRIDLSFYPASQYEQREPDSLSVLLLDKDGRALALPEQGYLDFYGRQRETDEFGSDFTVSARPEFRMVQPGPGVRQAVSGRPRGRRAPPSWYF